MCFGAAGGASKIVNSTKRLMKRVQVPESHSTCEFFLYGREVLQEAGNVLQDVLQKKNMSMYGGPQAVYTPTIRDCIRTK